MITKAATMTLVIGSAAVLTVVTGFAIAQLAQTSGTGTAAAATGTPPGQVKKTASPTPSPAEPPSKSLTISPNPLAITGLAPGRSFPRILTIGNPNNQDVVLQGLALTVSGASPSPAASLPCTATTTSTTSPDFEIVVAGSTTGDILKHSSKDVPVVIRMNNSATRNQNGCKAKTFTFTFTATATSN